MTTTTTTMGTLYVALELGQDKWLLACATQAAEKPRYRGLPARDLTQLQEEIAKAKQRFGLPADARDYGTGAQVLVDLGIKSMRLLTNNPAKRAGLEGYGLTVLGREPLPVRPHPENLRYLRTKRDRMGHLLDLDEVAEGLA